MRHAAGLTPEDRLDLSDLVHRYAAYVDAGLAGDVVALFTEDAVMVVPEPPRSLTPDVTRPRDRIHEAMQAIDGLVRTSHEVLGEVYDSGSADGTAHGTVRTVAHHIVQLDDGWIDVLWRGRYADQYRRTDDGWRFTRRELTIDIVEQRPVSSVRP